MNKIVDKNIDLPWIEKYRPNELYNIVLKNINFFKLFMQNHSKLIFRLALLLTF